MLLLPMVKGMLQLLFQQQPVINGMETGISHPSRWLDTSQSSTGTRTYDDSCFMQRGCTQMISLKWKRNETNVV
jgi:hypothetical protein